MEFRAYDLPVNSDERGNLVAVENLNDIPFLVKRVFYVYGNIDSLPRAGHANTDSEEACICLTGSCRVYLNDGAREEVFSMDKPTRILYIPKNVWVEITDFIGGCILLVLASENYNKDGYIDDFKVFMEFKRLIR
jgi:dTDP-4-dehydrorhamnose 3,5-epimerase-like enzyme